MNSKFSVCVITTSSEQIDNFILPYIEKLTENEKILLISSDKSTKISSETLENIHYEYIDFVREPSPLKDLSCLIKLITLLRKFKPKVTYSINPKTGLIAGLAGLIARIPVRVHMITGQVWATKTGLSKTFYKMIDSIIGTVCTNLIVDSQSQVDFLVNQGVINKSKAHILGSGSISGVNIEKFKRNPSVKEALRSELGLLEENIVILFMGRITHDKGVLDLLKAFELTFQETQNKNIKLIFVGPDEGATSELNALIKNSHCPKLIQVLPATNRPQDFFNMADIFCLPSYREGFGQVVIEAACAHVPTLGSRIYGLTDAIVENETGLLHEVKDITDLASQLNKLINNEDFRKQLGENAYKRVIKEFSEEAMVTAFSDYHQSLINN